MRLVRDDDDVLALGIRFGHPLAVFLDQAEHIAPILVPQHPAQGLAVLRLIGLAVGAAGVRVGGSNLVVELSAVGDHHEGIGRRDLAVDLLGQEYHRVGLARALRVPEHPQLPGGDFGLNLRIVRHQPVDDAIHAQVLVVAGHDLVRRPLAGVEQHEVLDDVQQAPPVQHPGQQDGQQRLILARLRIVLVQPLPAVEMLLGGGDGAVLRVVAIGDHDQCVPVEQVRDGVQVVGVVLLVGAIDMHLEALELDEHQRQAIHIADHIRPAQPEPAAHPQLAHGKVAVLGRVIEADQGEAPVYQPTRRIPILDRHPLAQQFVLLLVHLHEALGDVFLHHLRQCLAVGILRQAGVQAFEGGQHLADEHHLGIVLATQQAIRAEVFVVLREHRVPTKLFFQQLGCRRLDQGVFRVVFFCHSSSPVMDGQACGAVNKPLCGSSAYTALRSFIDMVIDHPTPDSGANRSIRARRSTHTLCPSAPRSSAGSAHRPVA